MSASSLNVDKKHDSRKEIKILSSLKWLWELFTGQLAQYLSEWTLSLTTSTALA